MTAWGSHFGLDKNTGCRLGVGLGAAALSHIFIEKDATTPEELMAVLRQARVLLEQPPDRRVGRWRACGGSGTVPALVLPSEPLVLLLTLLQLSSGCGRLPFATQLIVW
jgi:hypothetical protein